MTDLESTTLSFEERIHLLRSKVPEGMECLFAIPRESHRPGVNLNPDLDLKETNPPGRILARLLTERSTGWWLAAFRPGKRPRVTEKLNAQKLASLAELVGLPLLGIGLCTGRKLWTLWSSETSVQLETTVTYRQGGAMGHRRQPDHFSKRAQREGYAARSVYKLDEINKKRKVFRSGQSVLDLGCAPGSWVKFIAKKVGPKGTVVGIDRKAIDLGIPQVKTIAGDIFETDAQTFLELGGGLFDVITSDMAPDTCGDRWTDHVRSVALCERALHLSAKLLRPGGTFICKIFEGSDLPAFVNSLRNNFAKVTRIKPKSTRSESVELFLVAEGLRDKQPLEGE